MMKIKRCPCCSGKSYEECCAPYHRGKEAEDALILMRSRYSAYALHHVDYVIRTTHPKNPHYQQNVKKWKAELLQFVANFEFCGLEVIHFSSNQESAQVIFIAYLKLSQHDKTFTEKSCFEKKGGRWLYLCGEIKPGVYKKW